MFCLMLPFVVWKEERGYPPHIVISM